MRCELIQGRAEAHAFRWFPEAGYDGYYLITVYVHGMPGVGSTCRAVIDDFGDLVIVP